MKRYMDMLEKHHGRMSGRLCPLCNSSLKWRWFKPVGCMKPECPNYYNLENKEFVITFYMATSDGATYTQGVISSNLSLKRAARDLQKALRKIKSPCKVVGVQSIE